MTFDEHYIVLGAGAVGGTIGALLARSGRRVTLVARPAVVLAVRRQGGLVHIADGVRSVVPLEAVPDLEGFRAEAPPILFVTTKAGDLKEALLQVRRFLPADTLTVTWQNGIRAEDTALPIFPNLLGGIVRATSTMLVPGEVKIRTPGIMIAGRYPVPAPGTADPALDRVITHLREAGFDAAASPDIRADKALKLLLNLVSGASPLVVLDGSEARELSRVERAVLIEGARILNLAGIPAWPASGKGDDVKTMLVHLANRKPRPRSTDSVHNSTWQNLATAGRRLENDFMNGEIVNLARGIGRSAPWNERLLQVLTEVHQKKLGPEPFRDAELGSRFSDLTPPEDWTEDDDRRSRG